MTEKQQTLNEQFSCSINQDSDCGFIYDPNFEVPLDELFIGNKKENSYSLLFYTYCFISFFKKDIVLKRKRTLKEIYTFIRDFFKYKDSLFYLRAYNISLLNMFNKNFRSWELKNLTKNVIGKNPLDDFPIISYIDHLETSNELVELNFPYFKCPLVQPLAKKTVVVLEYVGYKIYRVVSVYDIYEEHIILR